MTKFYDCILFILTLLVCAAFIWLQKGEAPFIPPIVRPRVQETFQASPGSGSGSSAIILPTRTVELNAAKKTICNLQKVFDTLQCSRYLASNPNPPAAIIDTSRATVPQPSVAITGNIDNLSDTAIANGNLTGMIRANDMLYFGYLLDMQGPFVVKSISLASPIGSQPSVFAGSGTSTYVGGDGTGTAASFASPSGITIDSAGNFYVADSHRIRKITAAGVVTTLAGSGTAGSANGQGAAASFNGLQGLTIDSLGNLYAADTLNNSLRKITPQGLVTTIAGTTVSYPMGVAADSAGNIYTADWANHVIKRTTAAGVTTTYAGDGIARFADGSVTSSAFANSFNNPGGITIHPVTGDIYVADGGNNRIRRISATSSTNRTVSTYAGSGAEGNTDGLAASATFRFPRGLAFDSAGNLYVADVGNNSVRRITAAGQVDTIATNLQSPNYLVFDSIGNLYLTSSGGSRVDMIPASTVLTLTKKYVGANIRNSILSIVPSSADPSPLSGTIPVVETGDADEAKQEVYTFNLNGKRDYTLATAQAACATFGGEVATLAQFKQANMQGMYTLGFGLIKNDLGAPTCAMSLHRAMNSLTLGITFADPTPYISGLVCYGIKPPKDTRLPNGDSVSFFNSELSLFNNPTTIVGSIRAGTSYIATTNPVLPDDLSIGDLVYVQGRCNKYDTDNGDGTCTAYDCNTGEKDLLDNNQCQRFTCRDKAEREDTHTNNGDGTCTVPPQYSDCISGYTTSSAAGQAGTCVSVIQGTQYQKTVKIPAYTYDAIRAGKPSTRYTKTAQNPSYKYPKTLGPYYIAANPAIGNIQLKSKTPGDLDISGNLLSVSSPTWRLVATGAKWVQYVVKDKLYWFIKDDFYPTTPFYLDGRDPQMFISNGIVFTYRWDVAPDKMYFTTNPGVVGRHSDTSVSITLPNLSPSPRTFLPLKSASFDGFNMSLMVVAADNTVWYADSNITTSPNWEEVYQPGLDLSRIIPFVPILLNKISHSNGRWTGIWTDNRTVLQGTITRETLTYNALIPGGTTPISAVKAIGRNTNITDLMGNNELTEISFDGYKSAVAVLASRGTVFIKDLSFVQESITNRVSASFGLQTVSMTKVTSTDAVITSLVKRGTIINYDQCKTSGIVMDLANKNRIPGDSGALDATIIRMCNPFFTNDGWTGGANMTDTRKDIYKRGAGMVKTVSLNKKVLACAKGTYGEFCTQCPAGEASSTIGAVLCSPCAAGTFSAAGATSCSQCAAGTFSAAGASTCTACPAGKYSAAGAASCGQCPAGYSCSSAGTVTPQVCPAGTFSPEGALTCSPCPTGRYSAAAGAGSCDPCPAGYKCSSTGVVSPTACAAGTFSSEGASICSPCAAGKYSAAGAAFCPPCPAGTMCPFTGTATPQSCAAGTSSAAGATTCTSCAAGTFSSAGAPSCSACQAGTSSTPGAGSCTPCPAGTSSQSGGTCTTCPNNTFSAAGATSCTPCAANTYSSGGDASCRECGSDTPFRQCLGVLYNAFGSSWQKLRLPSVVRLGDPITARFIAGLQASSSRIRYVLSQPDGTVSQELTSNTGSVTFNGIHSKLAANSDMGKQTVKAYDVDWGGTLVGEGVVVTLPICDTGFYWPGSFSGATSCSPCPAGYTSIAGANACTECPESTYSTGTGGACIPCSIGTYNAQGESSCRTCGYDSGSQGCVGIMYRSYIDPMRLSNREDNRTPSFVPNFSLELASAVREGTPITVKLYSENSANQPLNTYGFTFELFQGNYFNLPTRVVVNPQEVTSSYVSATFAGTHSIPSGSRGNGKQFIVAYNQFRTPVVGGVVVTLP